MFDNNDDYDFNSSSSSKLASLFGASSLSKDQPNDTLIYKPTKQPNSNSKDSQKQSEVKENSKKSSSVIAKVVKLWKAVDKDYSFIGQFGLALIGSTDLNLYEIIGYNDKRNLIFRITLNNLIFCNQKDNFSTFCDNESQRWLVQFDDKDQHEFSQELEIRGVKIITSIEEDQQKTSSESEKQPPKPEVMPKPPVTADKPDVQSDSSESRKKADILNRMAKMGQQILPKVASKTTTSSDSDSELKESLTNRRVLPRKFKRNVQEKTSPNEEVLPVTRENQMLPIQSVAVGSYQHLPGTAYPTPSGLEWFNNYILAQNIELKINLAQISAKLDTVVNKGDSSNTESDDSQLKSKIKALELRSDNLQNALQKSESKYERLRKKYDKLMDKQKEDAMEVKDNEIKNLQKTVAKLTSDCETIQQKLAYYQNVEIEMEKFKKKTEEYEEIIETQKVKLQELEELCEQNGDSKELQATIEKLNAKMENLKLKQKDFDAYYKITVSEKQNHAKQNNEKINLMSEMVKRYISDMYQSVLDDFDQDESVTFKEIQGIVAKHLKDTTFKIIEDSKDIFSESSNLLSD